jgi:hypothetical protein
VSIHESVDLHQESSRSIDRLRLASERLKHLECLWIISDEKQVTDVQLRIALDKVGGNRKSLTLIRNDERRFHQDVPTLALPDLGKLCPRVESFHGNVNSDSQRTIHRWTWDFSAIDRSSNHGFMHTGRLG